MPDHIHWVFSLGSRLTLSQVVSKWKFLTRERLAVAGLEWQANYFEHRLRESDDVEAYAFYVFMNPYVAKLTDCDEAWPWWRKGAQIQFQFETQLTHRRTPQPEWLKLAAATGAGLDVAQD